MAKRKLTPKLKKYLYDNRNTVKLADYTGEALAYLKKLRASAKAAKTRKEKIAKVGKTVIPRNTELYKTIEAAAALKKMSVAKFVKKYKNEIEELSKGDSVVIHRETNYAIEDISKLPKGSKIYINNEKVSKGDAIYALQSITSSAMQHTNTVIIKYEMSYDLHGNLYLNLPTEQQLQEAEEAIENGEDAIYYEMLDESEGLIPVQSGKK
jgi:CO/xanthine dehydrogenase Mo-binding subunit